MVFAVFFDGNFDSIIQDLPVPYSSWRDKNSGKFCLLAMISKGCLTISFTMAEN